MLRSAEAPADGGGGPAAGDERGARGVARLLERRLLGDGDADGDGDGDTRRRRWRDAGGDAGGRGAWLERIFAQQPLGEALEEEPLLAEALCVLCVEGDCARAPPPPLQRAALRSVRRHAAAAAADAQLWALDAQLLARVCAVDARDGWRRRRQRRGGRRRAAPGRLPGPPRARRARRRRAEAAARRRRGAQARVGRRVRAVGRAARARRAPTRRGRRAAPHLRRVRAA